MTVADDFEINTQALDRDLSISFSEKLSHVRSLKSYIQQYGESNQSFDVLLALTNLTIERMEAGKDESFTALNILMASNIQLQEGRAPGSKLSPLWNKLMDNLRLNRAKGIQDFARNQGLSFYAWPEKDKSAGGHASKYYLKICPLPEQSAKVVEPLENGQIAYIRELTPKPSWWAKIFIQNGYRLEGWRQWLIVSYGVVIILLIATAVFLLWGSFWVTPVWSIKDVTISILATAVIVYAFGIVLKPLYELLEWRIAMAPASVVAFSELDVQIEIVREAKIAGPSPGIIRLVRYASICPQCDAKILLTNGGKEFPNRLVGRCRENPREHVYSFDRFSCKGRMLR